MSLYFFFSSRRRHTRFDCDWSSDVCSSDLLGKDLVLLAKHGRVVVIGSRGKAEINPRDTLSRDAAIFGMTLFNATEAEIQSIHRALYAGVENRSLRPIIGKALRLGEAAEPLPALSENTAYAQTILIPRGVLLSLT